MRKILLSGVAASAAALLLLLGAGCNSNDGANAPTDSPKSATGETKTGASSGKKIVIAWAEWEPAKQLEKLTKDFTKETGVEVEVQQIPWSDFENKVKLAWTGQESTFDLIIGDSQWLGSGATKGHYVDLTDWAKENLPLADIAPAALKSYGEYPAGSGKYYAVPCMSDATVFAYRKDLFEDAANKTAFQAKYKHPLDAPKTWDEFKQVAEFFTQPAKDLSGAALFYSKEYDGATMGFDQVLWSYGGKLSDGNKVQGVLNDDTGVKALTFYTDLKKFTPKGSENYYFSECLRDFGQGKVAMAQSWFAFLPDLQNPDKNKYVKSTGYFMIPKGPAGQFVSLGGQGLSLSAYSKHQDEAKEFIKWFHKQENQEKWVKLGGLTANSKVAATDLFKKATPYNAVFSQSVPFLKDFYNTPQYSELLNASQKEINEAIAGQKTPKAALDALATEQQKVMDATAGG